MQDDKKSLKPYLIGGAIGIASYIFLPAILNNVQGNSSLKKEEILSAVETIVQNERAKTENSIENLENKINNLNEKRDLYTNLSSQSYQPLNSNGYALNPAYSPPEAQIESPIYPQSANITTSYPSHDIYFSWRSNDKGIESSKREWSISMSTGKIGESISKFTNWFKQLVGR